MSDYLCNQVLMRVAFTAHDMKYSHGLNTSVQACRLLHA